MSLIAHSNIWRTKQQEKGTENARTRKEPVEQRSKAECGENEKSNSTCGVESIEHWTHIEMWTKKPIGYIYSHSVHNAHCATNAHFVRKVNEKERGGGQKEEKIQCVSFSNKKKTDFFINTFVIFVCVRFFFFYSDSGDSRAAPMVMHTCVFWCPLIFIFPFGKQSHIEKQKAAIMCLFRPFWSHTRYTHTARKQ